MQTRREMTGRDQPDEQRESMGELLGQLANNSAALVRDEIDLAKQEMSEKLTRFRSGVIITGIGALIGLVAILTLCAAAVIGLGNYVGPGYSALIIGAALALIGGVIAFAGISKLKQMSLKPEKTIETLQEDKEWLKELT